MRQKKPEPDIYRGIKEIGDITKFISFLEENVYNNFAEIKSEDIIKVASVYDYLTKQAKKSVKRDTKIFSEVLEILIFKVEKDRSVLWTTQNVRNFFIFLREQPDKISHFQESTIHQILGEGLTKAQEFLLHDLGSFTYSVSVLYPEYTQHLWQILLKEVQIQENFNFFPMSSLINILGGLFSIKDSEKLLTVVQDPNFQKFFDELLSKIKSGNFVELSHSEIFKVLHNLPSEQRRLLVNELAEKLQQEILNLKEMSDYTQHDHFLDILSSIGHLPDGHYKKELFLELNHKVLLSVVSKEECIITNTNEYIRSMYFKHFLTTSKSLNYFHVPLMDQVVMAIHKDINSRSFKNNPGILSECISCLAYLNYPGRFTAKIPHKEAYWTSWQSIIDKTEDFLLGSIGTQVIKDMDDVQGKNQSQRNINFLWSLCVFDVHSIGVLQTLLHPANISSDEDYGEDDMRKLFQIHYWLQLENNGDFELDYKLVEKMKKFKRDYDSKHCSEIIQSDFMKAVKNGLVENGLSFTENHSDFPYLIDFANVQKKSGILIDDEQRFLDGTNMQIRSGFHKVMSRQLVSLGWAVQKISLLNWLSLPTSDLLPR